MATTKYLSIDTNAKTKKGQKKGYLTGILYLAPSDQSGAINVCPHASVGCRLACLYTAGRGAMSSVKNARVKKTLAFVANRGDFIGQLIQDIQVLVAKAKKLGMVPAVRLNGTSDLPWENWNIMQQFPQVQFYDYTKHFDRMFRAMPANYHLTFSRAEDNGEKAAFVAKSGKNVAVVFDSKQLPSHYLGNPVVNGDESDLRFLDGKGVIVGLYAKGMAKKDSSGFVVPVATAA